MTLFLHIIKNRQHLYFLFILFGALYILPGSALAQFARGSGTEEDPYQIETIEQLQVIGESEEHRDKHFILINDIDAGETATWNEGKGFDPIGRLIINEVNEPFTGTFDGSGFTISNLTINRPDESYIGLFGYATRATIKNISLDHVQIEGDRFVGGLAGGASSELHEIQVTNAVISGDRTIGGVAGNISGTLSGSVFSGVLNVRITAGGLVGLNSGIIQQSYANVEISGGSGVGGLVGYNELSPGIMQSFAMGQISGGSAIGGLAGSIWGGEINDSYSMVNVSGESAVGGLVGEIESAVIGIDYIDYARINDSYAVGEVSGNTGVGGVIGVDYGGKYKSSYWDAEKSGQNEAAGNREVSGSRGLITTHMTGQDAYIQMYELDFDETWQLTEGYPVLRWQEPDNAVDQPEVPIVRVAPKEEEYDFGEVDTDSSSSRSYTLRNSGNVTMSGEVSLTGTHDGAFTIIRGEGDYMLEPDSSRVIEVEFRPASADTFRATLEIGHDAPNRDDLLGIQLKGTGKLSTSVDQEVQLPRQPELHQNHPNPFNPVTVIAYSLPNPETVTLQVYDVTGQLVETLINQQLMPAGRHQAVWDASNAASGTYLYRLQSGEIIQSRSMLLIK